ncbi:MAG: hypothetical protein NUW37_08890 [Planctomycetes bacterium]|nr:hypothetical protein [Planctomycetota bacterium]
MKNPISDYLVHDASEPDDLGTPYNISSTEASPGGTVKFQTNGFGAAPGRPIDPRWFGAIGNDWYLGKYEGAHDLGASNITGTHSGTQNFYYRDDTEDPPVLRNALLVSSGFFETLIERVDEIEITEILKGVDADGTEIEIDGDTREVVLNAAGNVEGEAIYLCEEAKYKFDATLHLGMHPELASWYVFKNGSEVASLVGSLTYEFTFPRRRFRGRRSPED